MAARWLGVGPDAHGEGAIVEVDSRRVSGAQRIRLQEGYSAFSVSKSQEEAVKRYIVGQHDHHKKEDFKSELLRILRAHGLEFDERYVFE